MPKTLKLISLVIGLWLPAVFVSVTLVAPLQILLLVALFLSYRDWRASRSFPLALWGLLAFAICCLLSSAFNADLLLDVKKNWGRFKYPLSGVASYLALQFWWRDSSARMRRGLLELGLGVLSLVCLIGICVFLLNEQPRLRGLTDTLRFGYGIGLVLSVLLASWEFLIKDPSPRLKALALSAFGLGGLSLLLAATRGALLGFLGVAVVLGVLSSSKLFQRLGFFALLLIAAMTSIYFFAPVSWEGKLIATQHRASDSVRFGQWHAAVDAIREKPIFGHGPANVIPQLDRIKEREHRPYSYYSGHSHNTFLEVAAGTGLVGLAAFLVWLIGWALRSYWSVGPARLVGISAVVYLLIAGQFEVMLDANNATLIFILWGLVSSYPCEQRYPVLNLTRYRMGTLVTAAVFFLCIGTFTSVTIQGIFQVLFTVPLLYYVWLARGRSFKLPASAWWLLAFAGVGLLSLIWSWPDVVNHAKNVGRLKYYLFGALGIFPVGVWLKTVSDRTLRRLGRSLAAAMAVSGLWNALQVWVLGAERARPLTETMRYSYGTTLVCVILLGLILHRDRVQSWFSVNWGILAAATGLLGMYATNSRGAQGALMIALPFVLGLRNRRWGIVSGIVMASVLSFFVYNYFTKTDSTMATSENRLMDGKNNKSDTMRRSQWQAALIAIKERPVLGWGMSNFHSQLKRIKEQYDLPHKEYNDAHAHNVLLEIGAGTGLVGLAVFVAFFLTWAWEMWQAGGLRRAIFIPFLVAIAFESQFEVILDANNATMIFFIYAVSQAISKRWQMPFS